MDVADSKQTADVSSLGIAGALTGLSSPNAHASRAPADNRFAREFSAAIVSLGQLTSDPAAPAAGPTSIPDVATLLAGIPISDLVQALSVHIDGGTAAADAVTSELAALATPAGESPVIEALNLLATQLAGVTAVDANAQIPRVDGAELPGASIEEDIPHGGSSDATATIGWLAAVLQTLAPQVVSPEVPQIGSGESTLSLQATSLQSSAGSGAVTPPADLARFLSGLSANTATLATALPTPLSVSQDAASADEFSVSLPPVVEHPVAESLDDEELLAKTTAELVAESDPSVEAGVAAIAPVTPAAASVTISSTSESETTESAAEAGTGTSVDSIRTAGATPQASGIPQATGTDAAEQQFTPASAPGDADEPTRDSEGPQGPGRTPTASDVLSFAGARHVDPDAAVGAPQTPTLSPSDPTQFVDRLSRYVAQAHDQGQQLSVRVTPPDLGSMLIEVHSHQGSVNVRLETSSPTAQQLLIESLPQLQEALAQLGRPVDRVDVVRSETGGGRGGLQADVGGDRGSQQTASERRDNPAPRPRVPQREISNRPPSSVVTDGPMRMHEVNIRI